MFTHILKCKILISNKKKIIYRESEIDVLQKSEIYLQNKKQFLFAPLFTACQKISDNEKVLFIGHQ